MGKYAQLANAADCKSVTLAVNIAGSIPALPTNTVASFNRKDRRLMRDSDVGSSPISVIFVDCGLMARRQIVALTIGVRFSSVNLVVT